MQIGKEHTNYEMMKIGRRLFQEMLFLMKMAHYSFPAMQTVTSLSLETAYLTLAPKHHRQSAGTQTASSCKITQIPDESSTTTKSSVTPHSGPVSDSPLKRSQIVGRST